MDDEGSGLTANVSTDNQSFSLCAARSLQRGFALPTSTNGLAAVRSVQFLYFFMLFSVGGILNLAIVWAVIKYKKLQTLDIAIALQVVAISLITIGVVIFPALVNTAAGEWIFGGYACSILGFIENTLRSVRRLLMVAMALDRFLLIFFPFKYSKYHFKAVIIFSAISWTGTIVFSMVGLPGILDCYTLSSAQVFCTFTARCSSNCAIFGYLNFTLLHLPFYVLPVIFYSAMYVKARKMVSSRNTAHVVEDTKKGNITFFLLFLTSFIFNVPNIGSIIVVQIVLSVQGFSIGLSIALFVLSHTILLLVVMDAVVIFRHRDIKEVSYNSWKRCTNSINKISSNKIFLAH